MFTKQDQKVILFLAVSAIFGASILIYKNYSNNLNIVSVSAENVSSIKPNESGANKKSDKRENNNELQNLVIDINKSGVQEFDKLPGIGPKTAKKIIDYRAKFGNFKVVDDIKKVPGIGEKSFEKIKPYIKCMP
ncbi:MAG: helix-hairpin-helix domain-containing protein [Candidatus Firestonebacteria bacterium]